MNIGKHLEDIFEGIIRIVRGYDITKKFQSNNRLLKQVNDYITKLTDSEEWTPEKRNHLFDYLISQASCQKHAMDLFDEKDMAVFYYQVQCMLATVKCDYITK